MGQDEDLPTPSESEDDTESSDSSSSSSSSSSGDSNDSIIDIPTEHDEPPPEGFVWPPRPHNLADLCTWAEECIDIGEIHAQLGNVFYFRLPTI